MSQYRYRVLQSDGSLSEGLIEAQGKNDAFSQLEARGWNPIQIEEERNGKQKTAGLFDGLQFSQRVSYSELENFTRLLSNLLAAGIPLSRALVLLYKETGNPVASARWKELHDLVVDGNSLADSMAQFPDTFPRVYVAMVQAGETGGFLDLVLHQIAEFQSREKDLRSKVMSALIYPAVLLTLAIAVVIFLMVFFIPRFQKLFSGFGADLPMLTQVIVSASDIIRNYGVFVAIAVGVAYYFARAWLATDQGKRIKETALLNLPVIGPLNAKFAMARFCRMLGTLLGAGVPLINSLNVARKSIQNQILSDAVSESIESVKKGDQLATSFADCKQLFPGTVLEMIKVAEETGRLDQELLRLSNTTESDLERNLRTAVSLCEPLMLFIIAGFIGTIFVGMVIPIFTIQDYIK
ncbi:MAG: type II secretion system F family protein [Candidatus Hinthialibacter antarcticus]|nr:type II secretion system F family protein [Candidatus Hinthialibacter antarcticus]